MRAYLLLIVPMILAAMAAPAQAGAGGWFAIGSVFHFWSIVVIVIVAVVAFLAGRRSRG